MAYIGAEPLPGQNREVDDISSSFNGSTTAFTLQVNGLNVSPETANNILVNIGGVIQNPGTDYTIAASTITFTTAPASGLSFFALILGAGINTATVADQTIGTSKVLDNAITADKLAHTSVTAGSYTTADITVDAQGRITAAASGTIANSEIADNAVTTAKIADSTGASDGVTTAKIATSAITTAKIADQAVDLSKLPHGTSSNNGKFLRANNGADPTFETVTGTTINNQADNRLITCTGTTDTLNGESGVSYDGSDFTISSGVLKLTDESSGQQLRIGADGDFFIEHDGNNTVLKNTTGNTTIQNDNNVIISASSGGTERFKVDSSGNATVSNGNLIIGTAGKGIDFSATADGSGSNQAELLDDYEEGTWTGTINVGTYSVFSTFRYTKIGNFVMVNGGLIINNTTDSAEFQISGLPFAGNGDQFIGNVWLRRTSTGDKKYIATIGQSGASIISYQHDSNGNDMGGAIAYSNFQNSSTYNNFTISYFTNS